MKTYAGVKLRAAVCGGINDNTEHIVRYLFLEHWLRAQEDKRENACAGALNANEALELSFSESEGEEFGESVPFLCHTRVDEPPMVIEPTIKTVMKAAMLNLTVPNLLTICHCA